MPPVQYRILKEMKYISDQQGIMERYLQEHDGWSSHLLKTRSFILNCVRKYAPQSVLIMGSGWLLDVPLDELAGMCERIYLVDICHPVQVEKKIKKYENCNLIARDLTGGGIGSTYAFVDEYKTTGRREPLHNIEINIPSIPEKVDYVISLNLLNQMDILLVDYIKKHIEYPESEINNFRKRIQEYHLSLLEPGRSCLVTDEEELVLNNRNQLVKRKKLIYATLPSGMKRQQWKWIFDTTGAYNKGHRTEFSVVAMDI